MSIDDIIKSRKTQKVLAEQEWDIPSNQEITHKTIHDLLDLVNATRQYNTYSFQQILHYLKRFLRQS